MIPPGSGSVPDLRGPVPALGAQWRDRLAIVNLRGRSDDAAFLAAVRAALGTSPPTEPCRTIEGTELRFVWAGPDDWFVIGARERADALERRLRTALSGLHAAVTDVSSGYSVLRLAGPPVRAVLAQGCPLDLHPRAFGHGHCAGSHFFKATVWLWRAPGEAAFELLVRRSFVRYVQLMLERSTRECRLTIEDGGDGQAPEAASERKPAS